MKDKQLKDVLNGLGTEVVPDDIFDLAEQVSADFVKELPQKPTMKTRKLWESIMRSKMTKFAAMVAVMVSLTTVLFTDWGTSKVYALEQTLEALHSVRYLHMKYFTVGMEEPKAFWFVCDEQGKIVKSRWYMPAWDAPEDGAKVVVWEKGLAKVWFKKKNSLVTLHEQRVIKEMTDLLISYDPKTRVQKLLKQESKGQVVLTFDEPGNKTLPIRVTADKPGEVLMREVLYIDQATLLVDKVERYIDRGEGMVMYEKHTFHGYNQPIDDVMFELEGERADLMKVDMTDTSVGLARGVLSEAAIAEKVAQQFAAAMVKQDFDMVGKLCGGIDPDFMRETLTKSGMTFKRVLKIGKAKPHPKPETQGWIVPVSFEVEKDGKVETFNMDRLGIRPIYGQPDRWAVFGGI